MMAWLRRNLREFATEPHDLRVARLLCSQVRVELALPGGLLHLAIDIGAGEADIPQFIGAHGGKLLALLGPSGSGKTSMLNALAGRVPVCSPNDRLTGSITVNGTAQADMSLLSACELIRPPRFSASLCPRSQY